MLLLFSHLHAPQGDDVHNHFSKNLKYMKHSIEYSRDPKHPHDCLKEVKIIEYSDEFPYMKHVLYRIEHCVSLEKIVIDSKSSCPSRLSTSKDVVLKDEERARRHAMSQLKPQIPSTVEFVCQ